MQSDENNKRPALPAVRSGAARPERETSPGIVALATRALRAGEVVREADAPVTVRAPEPIVSLLTRSDPTIESPEGAAERAARQYLQGDERRGRASLHEWIETLGEQRLRGQGYAALEEIDSELRPWRQEGNPLQADRSAWTAARIIVAHCDRIARGYHDAATAAPQGVQERSEERIEGALKEWRRSAAHCVAEVLEQVLPYEVRYWARQRHPGEAGQQPSPVSHSAHRVGVEPETRVAQNPAALVVHPLRVPEVVREVEAATPARPPERLVSSTRGSDATIESPEAAAERAARQYLQGDERTRRASLHEWVETLGERRLRVQGYAQIEEIDRELRPWRQEGNPLLADRSAWTEARIIVAHCDRIARGHHGAATAAPQGVRERGERLVEGAVEEWRRSVTRCAAEVLEQVLPYESRYWARQQRPGEAGQQPSSAPRFAHPVVVEPETQAPPSPATLVVRPLRVPEVVREVEAAAPVRTPEPIVSLLTSSDPAIESPEGAAERAARQYLQGNGRTGRTSLHEWIETIGERRLRGQGYAELEEIDGELRPWRQGGNPLLADRSAWAAARIIVAHCDRIARRRHSRSTGRAWRTRGARRAHRGRAQGVARERDALRGRGDPASTAPRDSVLGATTTTKRGRPATIACTAVFAPCGGGARDPGGAESRLPCRVPSAGGRSGAQG